MSHSSKMCFVALVSAIAVNPSTAVQLSTTTRKHASPIELRAQTGWAPGPKLIPGIEQSEHSAPALRKGVHVDLPVTRNATSFPEADQADALIVAVTYDGRIYLRVDPVTRAALAASLKSSRQHDPDQKVYLKVDARTLYESLAPVLDAAREADVESLALLTSQPGPRNPGVIVPPQGLEVLVNPRSFYVPGIAVANVFIARDPWPKVTVNNKQLSLDSLQTVLAGMFLKRSKKLVLLKAEATVPFSEIVDVTDLCRSQDAEVVLVTPEVTEY